MPVAASGGWTSGDTYSFIVYAYRTPFSTAYDIRFTDDGVVVEMKDKVALTPPEWVRLVGTAKP